MSSGRSIGLRSLRRPNRPLGYMRTCAVPNAVAGMFNTDILTPIRTAARSPEGLEPASGGGSRALISSFILPKVLKTVHFTAS